jgi:hypothetical protein
MYRHDRTIASWYSFDHSRRAQLRGRISWRLSRVMHRKDGALGRLLSQD